LWQDDTWQTPHRPGFRLSLMKKTYQALRFRADYGTASIRSDWPIIAVMI
jgi:hypothetical protein